MDINIVEKIQKLLALSESSNEHEAKLAMLKAQEFLARHKLSIEEVKEYKACNSSIIKKETEITFTKAKWKGSLAKLIGDNFACYAYVGTRGTHRIFFLGKEEDALISSLILKYAIDFISREVKKMRYKYKKKGFSTKGLENDYALGFKVGLASAFEKQREEKSNKGYELILLKDDKVTDAYKNMTFSNKVNTTAAFAGFYDEYQKGIKDGQKFSIGDKITDRHNVQIN